MMRQIYPVALLSALLVLATSAFAQHGNFSGSHLGDTGAHSGGSFGRFGGGSMGRFGGGSIGRFSSPAFGTPGRIAGFPTHSFGAAPRMTFTAPDRAFRTPATAPFMNYRDRGWNGGWRGWRGRSGEEHGDHHRRPYGGYGYGYGGYSAYPYAYASSWELLPWDLGDSDFTDVNNDEFESQQQQQEPAEAAAPDDSGNYYRPDYERPGYDQPGYDEGYPPPPPPDTYGLGSYGAAPASARNSIAPEPSLMLIFKDGHQRSIQNYVLTPTMVLVMDQPATGRQQRIPLADLNLPATEQAAQQAGLDFSPPN